MLNPDFDPSMMQGGPDLPPPLPEPPPTAEKVAPKGARTKEERQKLGMRICNAHRLGIQQKGDLGKRIRRNEEFGENRNIKPRRLPWPGAPFFHIPFMKQRLGKRKAAIVQSVLAPEAVFRFKRIGRQDAVKEVEQLIQFTLDAEDWQQDLDLAVQLAMYGNNVLFRVTYQDHPHGFEKATHTGPFSGPVTDVIHSDYACIFPAVPGPLSGKRLIAHCSEVRAADVMAAIKRGEYFKDSRLAGAEDKRLRGENRKEGDLQNFDVPSDEQEDANINLWDGLWKDDLDGKGERWYRVIYRVEGDMLFRIEEYPSDLPLWYAAGQIDREYGVWWTEGSPAQDLQGLQIFLNAAVNQFFWALQRITNASLAVERLGGDAGDQVAIPPGTLVPVKSLGKAVQLGGQGSLAGTDLLIQIITQFGDSAASTPDTMTGAPSTPRDATATEQNIKYMGFQMGSADDVTALAPALVQVAKIRLAMLAKYFDRFKECYGDAVAVDDPAVLQQPYTIELAGKAPEDAPQAQMDQARLIMELAAQFPEEGIPIHELVRTIILNSGLTNKDDLLRAVDEHAMAMGMIGPEQLLMAMMGGTNQLAAHAAQGGGPLGPDGVAQLLQIIHMASNGGMAPAGASPMLGDPSALPPPGP